MEGWGWREKAQRASRSVSKCFVFCMYIERRMSDIEQYTAPLFPLSEKVPSICAFNWKMIKSGSQKGKELGRVRR
jgi:hypothetical protein